MGVGGGASGTTREVASTMTFGCGLVVVSSPFFFFDSIWRTLNFGTGCHLWCCQPHCIMLVSNKPAADSMATSNSMRISSDFSTNRHAAKPQEIEVSTRHPDICFDDGNLAVLSGSYYFLVHQGVLSRRSDTLKKLVDFSEGENVQFLEGRPVLHLQDSPDDMSRFLQALYDGMYEYCFPFLVPILDFEF